MAAGTEEGRAPRADTRARTRNARKLVPEVRGDASLSLDDYWARPHTHTLAGIVEVDKAYGALPAASESQAPAWLYGSCFFWGLHPKEALALALLGNAIFRASDSARAKTRQLVALPSPPPCTLEAFGQTWHVHNDFPVAYQERHLLELEKEAAEHFAERDAAGALTPDEAEDRRVLARIVKHLRAAAAELPSVMWDPAQGMFLGNEPDATPPDVVSSSIDESEEEEEEEDADEEAGTIERLPPSEEEEKSRDMGSLEDEVEDDDDD
jgi:hypothetical protein